MKLLIFNRKEFKELNDKFNSNERKIKSTHQLILKKQAELNESEKRIEDRMNFWKTSNQKR